MAKRLQPYRWGQPLSGHDRVADTILTPEDVVGAVGPGEIMLSPRQRPTGMLYVTDRTLLFVTDSDYSPAVVLGIEDIHGMRARRVLGNAVLTVKHTNGQTDFGVAAQVGASAVALWEAARDGTGRQAPAPDAASPGGPPPPGYLRMVRGDKGWATADLLQALNADSTAAWSLLDASRSYLTDRSVQETALDVTGAAIQAAFEGSGRNPDVAATPDGPPEGLVAGLHAGYGWGIAKCEQSWGWARPGYTCLAAAYALMHLPATMGLRDAEVLDIPDALTFRATGYHLGRTT